jgi:hypothetical protein
MRTKEKRERRAALAVECVQALGMRNGVGWPSCFGVVMPRVPNDARKGLNMPKEFARESIAGEQFLKSWGYFRRLNFSSTVL